MLLRRVIEHVKAQNWTAVALDFAIVVVGVFIGIQVSNLNDARRDRADARLFLKRLHEDIVTADALSARLRVRRLDKQQWLIDASAVLFDGDQKAQLDEVECLGISTSHYFNINAAELPAFTELVSSGRLGIIRNQKLRDALVAFQQARDSLDFYASYQAVGVHDLPSKYPELISLRPYFDRELGEIQSEQICNLENMRKNRTFLNEFAENVDRYDAYVRDGLAPWDKHFKQVHALVDKALEIKHGADQ